MRFFTTDPAGLMAAPRAVLLPAGAPPPNPALASALPVWRVSRCEEGWAIHPEGRPPGPPLIPLPSAPGGVIAILAAEPPSWLADWPGPEAPPLARDPAELAALLARALAAAEARHAGLQRQILALRAEHEEARAAMAAWLASAGQAWPAPPVLAFADPEGPAAPLAAGRHRFRRVLPCAVDHATAVALHLPIAACGAGSVLSVRLIGEESSRLAGSWIVPGPALTPGWLALDLPMPAMPWGESAAVEIEADLAPGDVLALHPSLRLLRTAGAARFMLSPFWEPAAEGMLLPPEQVWLGLPEAMWEGQRRSVLLPGGGRAELCLPAVPVTAMAALRAEVALTGGAGVQAALWCGGAGSGWRDADPAGRITITLPLPIGLAGTAPVRLLLRHLGRLECRVAWRALQGRRGRIER
ncbi:MAG: DUF6212 domain-containing protein [Rhodovarius sp.]|nr:DUF6212 domain-containing protein [Rhodovarius sp.]